jgi:hypothetical protein
MDQLSFQGGMKRTGCLRFFSSREEASSTNKFTHKYRLWRIQWHNWLDKRIRIRKKRKKKKAENDELHVTRKGSLF